MADRMVTILESNIQRPMFVVGLAHWIGGESNLEVLLNNEGYTLQRVKNSYDPELLPEVSNEACSSETDIHSNIGESLISSEESDLRGSSSSPEESDSGDSMTSPEESDPGDSSTSPEKSGGASLLRGTTWISSAMVCFVIIGKPNL